MSNLLTPETFEFFARFLLAGYVVIFVRSAFVLGLRPKPTELLIEAVILSLISGLIVLALEGLHGWALELRQSEQWWAWLRVPPDSLKLVVRVLVVPSCLGLALGLFLQSNFRKPILQRLSLPVVHPVRRAHDYAFGRNRRPGLVEITYDDGTKIGGWFGENSLASSDDDRSDLYLERSYLIDDDGNWTEPKYRRSIWVSLKEVRSIEFISLEEGEND